MANISNYLEEKILDTVMKAGANTWIPATVYCGIVNDTAIDTDMEAGTRTNEITGYTGDRKAISWGTIAQSGGKATVSNSAAIEFESMPAPAGAQVKYAIICDSDTGDNILWWLPITAGPKAFNEGDTFRIPIGDLTIDID